MQNECNNQVEVSTDVSYVEVPVPSNRVVGGVRCSWRSILVAVVCVAAFFAVLFMAVVRRERQQRGTRYRIVADVDGDNVLEEWVVDLKPVLKGGWVTTVDENGARIFVNSGQVLSIMEEKKWEASAKR